MNDTKVVRKRRSLQYTMSAFLTASLHLCCSHESTTFVTHSAQWTRVHRRRQRAIIPSTIRASLSDTDETVRGQLLGKRVAITGGTGLLGRTVVRELLAAGADVTLLARTPATAQYSGVKRVRVIRYDASDGTLSTIALKALEDMHAVINLAGEPIDAGRWTMARKRVLTDSRIRGTRSLASALRNSSTKLVSASAIGIYGAGASGVLTETSEAGMDFLAKLASNWERAAFYRGLDRTAVLRFGVILSANGGACAKFASQFRLFAGGVPGNGTQWLSWVHIDDAARFIVRAVTSDEVSGVYNVSAPNPVQIAQFCSILANTLQRPCWLPVPAIALQAALGSEAAQLVLAGQRVLPKRGQMEGFQFQYGTLNAALEHIFISSDQRVGV